MELPELYATLLLILRILCRLEDGLSDLTRLQKQ